MHASMHTCTHIRIHTYMHTYMHTCIHADTHSHTHKSLPYSPRIFFWSTCVHVHVCVYVMHICTMDLVYIFTIFALWMHVSLRYAFMYYTRYEYAYHLNTVNVHVTHLCTIYDLSMCTIDVRWPCDIIIVCCSVLQCVAVCCSVLQCVAVCCSVL